MPVSLGQAEVFSRAGCSDSYPVPRKANARQACPLTTDLSGLIADSVEGSVPTGMPFLSHRHTLEAGNDKKHRAGTRLAGLLFSRGAVLTTAPRPVSIPAVGGVVSSLLLALLAFANRRYEAAPTPEAAVRLIAAPEDWLRWRFLGNILGAFPPSPEAHVEVPVSH